MFDDIKKQDQANDPKAIAGDGSPASPLPSSSPQPPAPPKKEVEDIFAKTDREPVKPDVFQPKAPASFEAKSEIGKGGQKAFNVKKYLILAVIALVLLGIILIGWYSFSKIFKDSGGAPVSDSTDGKNKEFAEDKTLDRSSSAGQAGNPALPSETDIQKTEKIQETAEETAVLEVDRDQDGLTDKEEEALGLNINSVDTDDDGLFDREEVSVYKTDPLNADTDGDGFLDGEEVRNGYNPKGAGRLYEIE